MIKRIDPDLVYIEQGFQEICRRPYYGHPNGCPNYGRKQGCPPNQPMIDKVLDFNKDLILIATPFCVGEFAEEMRLRHLDWTERQIYNPRYWQPRARHKFHYLEIEKARNETGFEKVSKSPEANGVHVTLLMTYLGIHLDWEWPPEHTLKDNRFMDNIVYLVSLAGWPIE